MYVALLWFPWCGLLLNTNTLEVASDYTRLFSQGAHVDCTFDTRGRAMDCVWVCSNGRVRACMYVCVSVCLYSKGVHLW